MRERLGQMGTVISSLLGGSAADASDSMRLPAAQESGVNPSSMLVPQAPRQQLESEHWPTLERQLHAYLDLLQQRSSLLTQVRLRGSDGDIPRVSYSLTTSAGPLGWWVHAQVMEARKEEVYIATLRDSIIEMPSLLELQLPPTLLF